MTGSTTTVVTGADIGAGTTAVMSTETIVGMIAKIIDATIAEAEARVELKRRG